MARVASEITNVSYRMDSAIAPHLRLPCNIYAFRSESLESAHCQTVPVADSARVAAERQSGAMAESMQYWTFVISAHDSSHKSARCCYHPTQTTEKAAETVTGRISRTLYATWTWNVRYLPARAGNCYGRRRGPCLIQNLLNLSLAFRIDAKFKPRFSNWSSGGVTL